MFTCRVIFRVVVVLVFCVGFSLWGRLLLDFVEARVMETAYDSDTTLDRVSYRDKDGQHELILDSTNAREWSMWQWRWQEVRYGLAAKVLSGSDKDRRDAWQLISALRRFDWLIVSTFACLGLVVGVYVTSLAHRNEGARLSCLSSR